METLVASAVIEQIPIVACVPNIRSAVRPECLQRDAAACMTYNFETLPSCQRIATFFSSLCNSGRTAFSGTVSDAGWTDATAEDGCCRCTDVWNVRAGNEYLLLMPAARGVTLADRSVWRRACRVRAVRLATLGILDVLVTLSDVDDACVNCSIPLYPLFQSRRRGGTVSPPFVSLTISSPRQSTLLHHITSHHIYKSHTTLHPPTAAPNQTESSWQPAHHSYPCKKPHNSHAPSS